MTNKDSLIDNSKIQIEVCERLDTCIYHLEQANDYSIERWKKDLSYVNSKYTKRFNRFLYKKDVVIIEKELKECYIKADLLDDVRTIIEHHTNKYERGKK